MAAGGSGVLGGLLVCKVCFFETIYPLLSGFRCLNKNLVRPPGVASNRDSLMSERFFFLSSIMASRSRDLMRLLVDPGVARLLVGKSLEND